MRVAVVAGVVVVFLGVSLLLARVLAADSRERSDIGDLMQAQARGDARAMLDQLTACDARCTAAVRADVARLRRPGPVKLVRFDPSTSFALGEHTGPARVVWNTTRVHRPVVQCVVVRRTGDPISGPGVELESVGRQLAGEASC